MSVEQKPQLYYNPNGDDKSSVIMFNTRFVVSREIFACLSLSTPVFTRQDTFFEHKASQWNGKNMIFLSSIKNLRYLKIHHLLAWQFSFT